MTQAPDKPEAKAIWPLLSLNFFMADMQAGIGPFLGVFLLAHGWQSGLIGTGMTVGGVAGMLMTTPAGALVDATRHKKLYVIIPGICTVIASGLILLSQNFWLVTVSQVATAVAGAAIGPAVSGITLGMVRQAGFNRQNGHNRALNHAGNMVGAGLSGLLGCQFGFTAVFWLAALFGVFSIISVLMIPGASIDDDEARGLDASSGDGGKIGGIPVLLECRPLLISAAALACFHLGNGAMLPLYGLAVVANKQGDPAGFVAITIVVAQGTMILASLIAMRLAEQGGLLACVAGVIHRVADPRRHRRPSHEQVGRLSGANPRRDRRRTSERGRPRPCRAHPQWHRARQCGAGRGHDGAGPRRLAQSRDRRMDRPGNRLRRDVRYPRQFCAGIDRVMAGLRIAAAACMCAAASFVRIGSDWRACRQSAVMVGVNAATWGIAGLATFGVIVRPWNLPEFIWAVAGAALLVLLNLLPWPDALAAAAQGHGRLLLPDRHDAAG